MSENAESMDTGTIVYIVAGSQFMSYRYNVVSSFFVSSLVT